MRSAVGETVVCMIRRISWGLKHVLNSMPLRILPREIQQAHRLVDVKLARIHPAAIGAQPEMIGGGVDRLAVNLRGVAGGSDVRWATATMAQRQGALGAGSRGVLRDRRRCRSARGRQRQCHVQAVAVVGS